MRRKNWELETTGVRTARAKGVRRAKRRGWRPPFITRDGSGLHGHHVMPIAKGGDPGESNVVVLCPNHHLVAHALDYAPYRRGIKRQESRAELLRWLRLADSDPAECVRQLRVLGVCARSISTDVTEKVTELAPTSEVAHVS